jgi:intracellular multiplication protein IcmE
MADLKNNFGTSLVSNPKIRILLAGVVIVGVVAAGAIGWKIHLNHERNVSMSGAQIIQAPSVASTPGAQQTSAQYTKDVAQKNLQQEQAARDPRAILSGSSNVPTINQPGLSGDVNAFDNPSVMSDGRPLCPEKVLATFSPNPLACTVSSLTSAHDAGVLASELRCQGCTCDHLKAAGFNASNLKDAGFSVQALSTCGFNWTSLKEAGFSASELKAAGAASSDLYAAGFSAAQLHDAGYSAKDLIQAGFSPTQLQQAGYTAKELLVAGATAAQLKQAGYSANQLADAGVSANDLAQAGFTPSEISAAILPKDGVCSQSAISKAREKGASIQALKNSGCSIAALRQAGVSAAELIANGASIADLKAAGFSANDLKKAGVTATDLKNAGFSAAQLANAGFSAAELKNAGFSSAAMKDAGFSAAQLKSAGFSAQDLKSAGFSAGELSSAGFTAKALKDAGYDAASLKAAGFSASDLLNAGISPKDIAAAGYTKGDLLRAGLTPAEAGVGALPTGSSTGQCSVQSLRGQRLSGTSATQAANNGCSLEALKAAGYDAASLLKAGFTPTQLHDAGVSAAQLVAAGVSPSAILAAGFTQLPLSNSAAQSGDAAVGGAGSSDMGLGDFSSVVSSNNSPEARMQRLQQQQQAQIAKAQIETQKQQIYSLLDSEAQKLLSGWASTSTQTYVAAPESTDDASLSSATGAIGSGSGAQGKAGDASSDDVLKAGTVMFGILTIGINTDETSPIMAKIISGSLNGSTLMGSFTRENNKVMLKFNRLNMPDQKNTISIDTVAIDPSTARTVVSGHVNNHYLIRYGALMASSFLGSLGQALSNANSFCFGPTFCVQQTSGFSTSQQILIGLGGVGTKLGTEVATKENTTPTVTIPAGTSIGILLMSDFTMPKSDLPKPVQAPSQFNHQVDAQ